MLKFFSCRRNLFYWNGFFVLLNLILGLGRLLQHKPHWMAGFMSLGVAVFLAVVTALRLPQCDLGPSASGRWLTFYTRTEVEQLVMTVLTHGKAPNHSVGICLALGKSTFDINCWRIEAAARRLHKRGRVVMVYGGPLVEFAVRPADTEAQRWPS